MAVDSYHLRDGAPAGPEELFAFVVTRFGPREHYRYRLQWEIAWDNSHHDTRDLAITAAVEKLSKVGG